MRTGLFGLNSGTYTIGTANPTVSLTIGAAGGGFDVAPGATLTLAKDVTFSTSGGPQGPMVKAGGGTLAVTSALTHNGPVQVNQGTVLVNAATNATSIAGFFVNNGGTLGGTGTINGTAPYGGLVTVNAGGTLAPGLPGGGPGTLTAAGAVWRPNGRYDFDHDPNSPTADLVTGGGALDLTTLVTGNMFTVNLLPTSFPSPAPTAPQTYTLATFAGGIRLPPGQDPSNLNNLFTFTGFYNQPLAAFVNGSSVQVTFTPVPEPAFVLLACGAAAGLAGWRRRATPAAG
jgi:autotransporter-associated beta strand protein